MTAVRGTPWSLRNVKSTCAPQASSPLIGSVRACSRVQPSLYTSPDILTILQVVLFNHVSWVDSLVMMRMFAPSGVAKARVIAQS